MTATPNPSAFQPPRDAKTAAGTAQLPTGAILFTAFEPSGDAHAAPVIAALKRRHPEWTIYAWGGPKMEAAGATIIERTSEDGAMGLGAVTKLRSIRAQQKRIRKWAKGRRLLAHVPVDAPAVNFPICKHLRKGGTRTIHLVAPQLWAWGRWRKRKLRRRTDHVLCLLPFEEEWFRSRRIPATFIGHPVINRDLDEASLDHAASMLPQGAPRLAIFPGSRSHEVKKNIGLLLAVFRELQGRHADVSGIVVAAKPALGKLVKARYSIMPTGLHVVTVDADIAVRWCDFALTVAGTMSLDLARQHKPMIGLYCTSRFAIVLGWLLLRTKHRLLPNIIAGKRIVPEFVPYAGGPMKIVLAATPFLSDSKLGVQQGAELRKVTALFAGHSPGEEAAAIIAKIVTGARM